MMDSPSVITSNSSGPLVNSSSEEDLRLSMDQNRKLKRMISNRQSAQRSRLRKQKLMEELTAQVARLRQENHEIFTGLTVTTKNYLNVEAENTVLRVQVAELSHRLESLNDIVGLLGVAAEPAVAHGFDGWNCLLSQASHNHQHHVMASADVVFMW